jgi:broad specificity phosphatase PhoE
MPPAARVALAAIVGFLIGFGWQYASARSSGQRLDTATRELRLARLEATLAVAVTEAQRGDYEHARTQASAFFTEAQRAVTTAKARARRNATLSGPEEALRQLLLRRDSTVTLLSRNDTGSTSMLVSHLAAYRAVLHGITGARPTPPANAPAAPAS